MLRISWTAKKSNKTMLQKAATRSLINRICNIFLQCDEKRETGTCCDNWNDQQREKILDRLTKWLNVGRVTDALKATRD